MANTVSAQKRKDSSEDQMFSLSRVKRRLSSLGANLEPLSACAFRYVRFGVNFEASTTTIAPMPWIAPLAKAFWLYEPLGRGSIPRIVECPRWYADLLAVMNGCFAFGLSLYGIPTSSGLVERTILRPLSLETANRWWRQEYRLAIPAFHFGGGTLNYSENVGYFEVDGQIASIRKNGEVVRFWSDFRAFLTDELARVEAIARENPEARKVWGSG